MTEWVESPGGGRDRGPVALVRAWAEVLVRPRHFFRVGVAPGDQAPGLTFAMFVVAIEEAIRLTFSPGAYPVIAGRPGLSTVLLFAVAILFVTPAALHLAAAVQTLALMVLVDDRAGVSETVQVIGYASAPCLVAGLPSPSLRVACGLYGTVLLIVGIHEVHEPSYPRAMVATAVPAALVFGYGFRAFAAGATLVEWASASLG